jgi:disulfide bond formation protein DsbB
MQQMRFAPVVILVASVAVVGTALLSQYVGGLYPCELCLYERWPYYTAIVVTALALLIGKARLATMVVALSVLIFAAGSALAFYHVGVEQRWIQGPTACTGDLGQTSSPEALLQALQGREPVQCDVVQWSFHGITLAGLNLAISLSLMGYALWAVTRPRRSKWR